MSRLLIVKMNGMPCSNVVKHVFLWHDVKHSQHIGVPKIVDLHRGMQ